MAPRQAGCGLVLGTDLWDLCHRFTRIPQRNSGTYFLPSETKACKNHRVSSTQTTSANSGCASGCGSLLCKPGPNLRFQLLSMKPMLSMPLVFIELSRKGVLKWGDRSFTNVGQIWTICQTLSCLSWQWLRHRITPGQSPVRYTHSDTGWLAGRQAD